MTQGWNGAVAKILSYLEPDVPTIVLGEMSSSLRSSWMKPILQLLLTLPSPNICAQGYYIGD